MCHELVAIHLCYEWIFEVGREFISRFIGPPKSCDINHLNFAGTVLKIENCLFITRNLGVQESKTKNSSYAKNFVTT